MVEGKSGRVSSPGGDELRCHRKKGYAIDAVVDKDPEQNKPESWR